MTTLYATIGRTQRERGGLVLEAMLDGDAAAARRSSGRSAHR